MKTLLREKFTPPTLPKPHPFSLSKRKMEDFALAKITDMSTKNTIQDAYPLPLISDLIDKLRDTKAFSKFVFNGGTTAYESRMVTNGRQPLSPIKGCLNPQLCSSVLPTPLLPSNDS